MQWHKDIREEKTGTWTEEVRKHAVSLRFSPLVFMELLFNEQGIVGFLLPLPRNTSLRVIKLTFRKNLDRYPRISQLPGMAFQSCWYEVKGTPASLSRSFCLCVSSGWNFFTIFPPASIQFNCTREKSLSTLLTVGYSHDMNSWHICMDFLKKYCCWV